MSEYVPGLTGDNQYADEVASLREELATAEDGFQRHYDELNAATIKSINYQTPDPSTGNINLRLAVNPLASYNVGLLKLQLSLNGSGSHEKTIYNSAITSNMVILNVERFPFDAQTDDWYFETADGSLTFRGSTKTSAIIDFVIGEDLAASTNALYDSIDSRLTALESR